MHLCPVCLKKLEWNLKFDRNERHRKLRNFYKKVGFEKEADFAECRIRALTVRVGD